LIIALAFLAGKSLPSLLFILRTNGYIKISIEKKFYVRLNKTLTILQTTLKPWIIIAMNSSHVHFSCFTVPSRLFISLLNFCFCCMLDQWNNFAKFW